MFNVQQKGKIPPENFYNLMENTLYILHHHFGIFNLEQFFYFLPDFQPVGFKDLAEVVDQISVSHIHICTTILHIQEDTVVITYNIYSVEW